MSEHRQDFGRSDQFLLGLDVLKLTTRAERLYSYILIALFPGAVELETVLANDRLDVATTAMRSEGAYCVFDKWVVVLGRRSNIANEFHFCNIPYGSKSGFRIAVTQRIHKFGIRLVDFEFTTRETDTFEDLFRLIEETYVMRNLSPKRK